VEYETILLASGIMVKKGDTTVYSYSKLEYLQGVLHGRLNIHICRSKIDRNGIALYFVAVERPTFRNPSLQGKAEDLRVLPNRHGNGLDEERVLLLERLCAERASTNEPELIVDEQLPPPPQIEDQCEQENEPPPQDYNVEIIFQAARSPEVNALDLGVWMSVQHPVENIHRTRARDPDSLAATVQEAWDLIPASTITKIFN
jgi:hypothetical protein